MTILYRTVKFNSANICAMTNWGPTAKSNSSQYFWLLRTAKDAQTVDFAEACKMLVFSSYRYL